MSIVHLMDNLANKKRKTLCASCVFLFRCGCQFWLSTAGLSARCFAPVVFLNGWLEHEPCSPHLLRFKFAACDKVIHRINLNSQEVGGFAGSAIVLKNFTHRRLLLCQCG